MDGNPNPYFDDLTNDNVPDGRVAIREGYIRSAYEEADETLGLGRELMGEDATMFVSSDHGFAPQWYAVNVARSLADARLQGPSRLAELPGGRRRRSSRSATRAAPQLYIDLAGREPATAQIYVNPTLPAGGPTRRSATTIVNYFQNLDDPNLPGQQQVVLKVIKKEELRNVDGTDSLHPNRSGDVVVVFRPPYQTDAATPGSRSRSRSSSASTGTCPTSSTSRTT